MVIVTFNMEDRPECLAVLLPGKHHITKPLRQLQAFGLIPGENHPRHLVEKTKRVLVLTHPGGFAAGGFASGLVTALLGLEAGIAEADRLVVLDA